MRDRRQGKKSQELGCSLGQVVAGASERALACAEVFPAQKAPEEGMREGRGSFAWCLLMREEKVSKRENSVRPLTRFISRTYKTNEKRSRGDSLAGTPSPHLLPHLETPSCPLFTLGPSLRPACSLPWPFPQLDCIGENEREVALLFNVRGGGGAWAGLAALTFEARLLGAAARRSRAPCPARPSWLSKSILSPARCK